MNALQSQAAFRAMLSALVEPGRWLELPNPSFESPVSPAATAILFSVLDSGTSLALHGSLQESRLWWMNHLEHQAATADSAHFLLATSEDWDWKIFPTLRRGTEEEPENSVTLLLDVPRQSPIHDFVLSGPGIDGTRSVALPVPVTLLSAWQKTQHSYPLGVDVFLCQGQRCMGMPRTLQLCVEESCLTSQ